MNMNPANILRNHNRFSCSHCQCSTVGIGSKLLTDYLNIAGPDIASHPHLKPTILEAVTLIFGFRMPAPEVVINTTTGIQYFNTNGQSYHSLSICINCESVLTNLYKVFLLFTELSNGKESFILRNSIISGRLQKEVEVIPIHDTRAQTQTQNNPYRGNVYVDKSGSSQQRTPDSRFPASTSSATGNVYVDKSSSSQSQLTVSSRFPVSSSSSSNSLNTICRDLTSEVVAEMYVPNAPPGITITPILNTTAESGPPVQKKSTNKPLPSLLSRTSHNKSATSSTSGSTLTIEKKPVEIITLEDEDNEVPSTSSKSKVNNQTNLTSTGKKVPQRFVPLKVSTPMKPNGNAVVAAPGGGPQLQRTVTALKRLVARNLVSTDQSQPPQRPRLAPPLPSQPHAPLASQQPQKPSGVTNTSSPLSIVSNRRGMVTRVTTSTSSSKYKCDSCPYHFPSVATLLAHTDKVHGSEKGGAAGNRCRFCPRTFHSPSLLRIHLRYHNKESSLYICQAAGCDKSYYELRLLRRHQTLSGHVNDPEVVAKGHDILMSALNGAGGTAETPESEADYWTKDIEVIHDPEEVMKKVEASAILERIQNETTTST